MLGINFIEDILTFTTMVIKFPMRILCKKKEHDWIWYGGGFSFFAPKYPFICHRCGCRSKGDFEDIEEIR